MPNRTVLIRPVEPADAVQLQQNCFRLNTLEQTQELIAESLQRCREGKEVLLVAVVDGQVAGTATLQRQVHRLRRHRAEVGGLVVHPTYQRQGIARRLVAECRRRAQAMGIEILELTCRGGEPAEAVYRHLGFVEYGRLPRGLVDTWGEPRVYDEVYFYQPTEDPHAD